MDENGAACALFARMCVPARFNHRIIKRILSPHLLMALGKGQSHQPVIRGVGDGITPTEMGADKAPAFGMTAQKSPFVGTQKQAQGTQIRHRCRTIAFAFGKADPVAAQREAALPQAEAQNPFLPVERRGEDKCGLGLISLAGSHVLLKK